MQSPTFFKRLPLQHDISIPSSRGSCHNVFVERERDENNDRQEIYNSANSTHGFGTLPPKSLELIPEGPSEVDEHFLFPKLQHISTLEASLHEGVSEPSYQAVGKCEGNAAECDGDEDGLPILSKGVRGNAAASHCEQTEERNFFRTKRSVLYETFFHILFHDIFHDPTQCPTQPSLSLAYRIGRGETGKSSAPMPII